MKSPPADFPMSSMTCPFCNAIIPTPALDASGRRLCPRCGENLGGLVHESPDTQASRPEELTGTPTRSRPRRLWLIGIIVLGATAAIGGWLAWRNWESPSANVPGNQTGSSSVIRPADMPGLGLLPAATEVVFAVQVPGLMERLGSEGPDDPAAALAELGVPESIIEFVEKASGVGLRNVDQVVLGLGFQQSALPPQAVLVVHTRAPFDLEAIAREAKANRLKRGARTLYAVRASPVLELYWWTPGDRVLVATLAARDFDAVPVQPKRGIEHLATDMTRLIRQQLADDACAWLAASSDRWDERVRPYTILPLTPLQGRTDLLAPAQRLQSVSVSISQDSNQPADIQLRTKSRDAAEELRTALAQRFRGEPIEVTGDDVTCRLRTPFDPSRFGSLIGRLIPRKN